MDRGVGGAQAVPMVRMLDLKAGRPGVVAISTVVQNAAVRALRATMMTTVNAKIMITSTPTGRIMKRATSPPPMRIKRRKNRLRRISPRSDWT
jgi:hypothetical protein